MEIFKKLILFSFIFLITSCGTVKEGFKNQKKNSNDEFLVEKKSPLIMPPDYNELPLPNAENKEIETDKNSIKSLVTNEENGVNNSNDKRSKSEGIEKSLLEKIKNN